MKAQRRRSGRGLRRGAPVQTVEQPVYNAGPNYAASTAATAGVAIVRDAEAQQEAVGGDQETLDRAEQAEIASTLTAVLGLLGVLVALTAVTPG